MCGPVAGAPVSADFVDLESDGAVEPGATKLDTDAAALAGTARVPVVADLVPDNEDAEVGVVVLRY